ncbi:MAG: SDR family oxidoreductase [Brevundimonas sp.]
MMRACIVIGAGDATGGAIARRFAREGFAVGLVRRTADKLAPLVAAIEREGGRAIPYAGDARKEEEMKRIFDAMERDVGPIEVAVFNIGANVPCSILEETPRKYIKIWELACLSGFFMGREAARRMTARGEGTILFTGATASIRGSAHFAAFAGAKHGLRALAQSMARELWPKNVHVAHIIIDGAIDTAFIRDTFPERYATKDRQGILDPDSIADAYWHIHTQSRDAWTFEMDLRPWIETW